MKSNKLAIYQWLVFVAAFLLFSVQPLVGKFILPWFGGSPSVWITAVMFFQVALLAGYVFAYFISHLKRSHQFVVYSLILLSALFFLPITPDDSWQVFTGTNPVLHIFLLLLFSVGLPYFILALSSPLLQSWYSQDSENKISPYRLYAFSNGGSLIGLLSYPILVEPLFNLEQQTKIWSVVFILFVVGAFLLALKWNRLSKVVVDNKDVSEPIVKKPTWFDKISWILLPFFASTILLSVTNYITQDLVAVPFLWILPLVAYLFSFIVTFYSKDFYDRRFIFPIFIIASILSVLFIFIGKGSPIFFLLITPLAITTIYCIVCHGELYLLKPANKYLTSFYLYLALGGALGGIFVALVAPIIFPLYFELHLSIGLTLLFVFIIWFRDRQWLATLKKPTLNKIIAILVLIFIWGALLYHVKIITFVYSYVWRDFYGVIRLYESNNEKQMYHGSTLHGTQFLSEEKRCWPTTYYGESSGLGQAVLNSQTEDSLNIGVVGLGVGTAAVYGDYVSFYELNPQVVYLAEREFSYLSNCAKKYETFIGDGRLLLEKEDAQNFDILVLDAFSSDTVPAHLLTKEAFVIYLRHIKENGVIVVHISNRYIDLKPVIGGIAEEFNLKAAVIDNDGDSELGTYDSSWVALSYSDSFFGRLKENDAIDEDDMIFDRSLLWTDKYSNLFTILRFE